MSTWRARIGVVLIFVVGILCGGFAMTLVRARAISHAIRHPEAWAVRMERQLGRRLDLTREQRLQVRAILADASSESSATLRRVQPDMLATFDRTQGRINAVLDAKQRSKFAEISARRRAHFLERFAPQGPAAPAPAAAAVPTPAAAPAPAAVPAPASQPR